MRRDLVIIGEMIAAAESAIEILGALDASELGDDRLRRNAVLGNVIIQDVAESLTLAVYNQDLPKLRTQT